MLEEFVTIAITIGVCIGRLFCIITGLLDLCLHSAPPPTPALSPSRARDGTQGLFRVPQIIFSLVVWGWGGGLFFRYMLVHTIIEDFIS